MAGQHSRNGDTLALVSRIAREVGRGRKRRRSALSPKAAYISGHISETLR